MHASASPGGAQAEEGGGTAGPWSSDCKDDNNGKHYICLKEGELGTLMTDVVALLAFPCVRVEGFISVL